MEQTKNIFEKVRGSLTYMAEKTRDNSFDLSYHTHMSVDDYETIFTSLGFGKVSNLKWPSWNEGGYCMGYPNSNIFVFYNNYTGKLDIQAI